MSLETFGLLMAAVMVTLSLLVAAQWIATALYNRNYQKEELRRKREALHIHHLVLYNEKVRERR